MDVVMNVTKATNEPFYKKIEVEDGSSGFISMEKKMLKVVP
jgi:hypothetical protein